MKELGSFLKRARISNGVSLDEAASDLSLSITQLENIESGNTKAFRDIYELKEHIITYTKYLGLNPDEVLDVFNEFLFEKTSKISLQDIREAEQKEVSKTNEEKRDIRSPYTLIRRRKINIWPILIWFSIILLITSIALIIIKNISKEEIRKTELKPLWEDIYEFTY
ncbi:MAG: helix-turn-helix domain-containing protein [Bacilli bacterium]|nr:helix-turn-helix domain-containing protein [Bacilli bacterium]